MGRRVVVAVWLAALLGAGGLPALAKPAVQRLCFGKPATIRDHTGEIFGTPGDDVIIGDAGDNDIEAGGGTDRVCAGAGNDVVAYGWAVEGDPGAFLVDGGPGFDRLAAWAATTAVMCGGPDLDVLSGSAGPDRLFGGPGGDLLQGFQGDDLIFGGPGADELRGDDGLDVLDGGTSRTKSPLARKATRDRDVCYPGRDGARLVRCEVRQ